MLELQSVSLDTTAVQKEIKKAAVASHGSVRRQLVAAILLCPVSALSLSLSPCLSLSQAFSFSSKVGQQKAYTII